jgi:serine/threonine protein kinase
VIDKNSGNQYAAKILRYADPIVKEELMTELEILALLDHQNIIQIIDGYEDKKRLIMVMEMYPMHF